MMEVQSLIVVDATSRGEKNAGKNGVAERMNAKNQGTSKASWLSFIRGKLDIEVQYMKTNRRQIEIERDKSWC